MTQEQPSASPVVTVAIDGPAAAGKSTISKRLAVELGLTLVDTGALYRCVALVASRRGVAWDDEEGVASLLSELEIRFRFEPPINHVFIGDEDVSVAIREAPISKGASAVSGLGEVRAGLLELQRRLAARPPGAVLEGRDIGTVVLPDASVKFFLTARPEIRARRRYDERIARGESVVFEEVLAAEMARDRADSTRALAPLRQAEDAILVDSSDLEIEAIVGLMAAEVRGRVSASGL